MTRYDEQKETCSCRICRSDMAYVAPCEFRDVIDFVVIGPATAGEYEVENPQQDVIS